ncbi:CopG family transcriptional regulator [Methyloprofundus sedimenti]|uniref:CopG family transcriptional regulator n=1 Tax=Methyloprofundus sedimenti TaxID=1420851 RepID=A0A1V8MB88_9GAMM|nr:ribbon-helix-helix protein, CopG family [Methyloprofundus sedimenti]OQK18593.1 CopG family transcriptional regulator [Methyloprofundus sedimenti]
MAANTTRVTLLIDPDKKRAFEQICANQDMTSSQVIRRLIREYIEQHATVLDKRRVVE